MKDNLKGVGIWGQRHYEHLKATKPSVIGVVRMNGNLIPYLQSVDEQAEEMTFQLVKQFAKQEGVTEELKRRDQMAWVGAMNVIRDRVNEIVNSELIFHLGESGALAPFFIYEYCTYHFRIMITAPAFGEPHFRFYNNCTHFFEFNNCGRCRLLNN